MTTTKHETTIEASKETPTITIVREFDAPPELVFRAHAEKELYAKWLGPRDVGMHITTWDFRTGGSWAYSAERDGDEFTQFFGSFHEVRENERIVQTFTWRGAPDGASLEFLTLEPLPGGRTRLTGLSVVESFETQAAIMASGMEKGVLQGYEQLDELLAELS